MASSMLRNCDEEKVAFPMTNGLLTVPGENISKSMSVLPDDNWDSSVKTAALEIHWVHASDARMSRRVDGDFMVLADSAFWLTERNLLFTGGVIGGIRKWERGVVAD